MTILAFRNALGLDTLYPGPNPPVIPLGAFFLFFP